MVDKTSDSDVISSTDHSEAGVPVQSMDEKKVAARPNNNRRVSEWEALQIAAAGDIDTIDREIAEVEADLQQMNIRSTWYKPQLKLSDPRYFTWLLVGKLIFKPHSKILLTYPGFASMGGLLSGIDQSLISGANLFMPTGKHFNPLGLSALFD